jgi:hypothetical protein
MSLFPGAEARFFTENCRGLSSCNAPADSLVMAGCVRLLLSTDPVAVISIPAFCRPGHTKI